MKKKNENFIINDSDKNLGAAAAEKDDVIKECTRQLYDMNTYLRMLWEEAQMFTAKIRMELLEVINKFILKKEYSPKEVQFLTSKSRVFTLPHFYIIWKLLKIPPIGRPISLAGYDRIHTPTSIFSKFEVSKI